MTETLDQRLRKITLLLVDRGERAGWATHLRAKPARLASQPGPAPCGQVPCSCGVAVRVEYAPLELVGHAYTHQLREGGNWVGSPGCLLCFGSGFRNFDPALDSDRETDGNGRTPDPYIYGSDVRKVPAKVAAETARENRDDNASEDGFPWERQHPTQRALDRALDALRIIDESAHGYVIAAYCLCSYGLSAEREPSVGFEAGLRITRGLGVLERRMPTPIVLPGWLLKQYDAEELTRVIKGMSGKSERQIARELGVDRRTVRKRLRAA